jgi:hypothetical protein
MKIGCRTEYEKFSFIFIIKLTTYCKLRDHECVSVFELCLINLYS